MAVGVESLAGGRCLTMRGKELYVLSRKQFPPEL